MRLNVYTQKGNSEQVQFIRLQPLDFNLIHFSISAFLQSRVSQQCEGHRN